MDYETQFTAVVQADVPPELPKRYNEDTLVGMPRDPWWVYAYWEVSDATRNAMQEKHGADLTGSEIVLRACSFDGKSIYSQVSVGTLLGSWYLQIDLPLNQFVLELGYLTKSQTFVSLLRSKEICLPRERFSDLLHSEWMLDEMVLRRLSS